MYPTEPLIFGPNITGRFFTLTWSPAADHQTTGAFPSEPHQEDFDRRIDDRVDKETAFGYYKYEFDANKASSIYSGDKLLLNSFLSRWLVSYE